MKFNLLFGSILLSSLIVAQSEGVVKLDNENNGDYSTLNFLEEGNDIRVYLTGENHNFLHQNYKTQLKIFKFLHENKGVDHYIFEFGEGAIYLFNRYLEGESDITEIVDDAIFNQQVDFLKELKEYYDEQKLAGTPFELHSADLDHNMGLTFAALNHSIGDVVAHDSVDIEFSAIRNLADYYRQYSNGFYGTNYYSNQRSWDYNVYNYSPKTINVSNSIRPLVETYNQKRNYFKECLGDRFEAFDKIMSSLVKSQVFMEYAQDYAIQSAGYRENAIYNKVLSLAELDPESKFYGQLGVCHLLHEQGSSGCFFESFKALGSRLNDKMKVLIIPQLYKKDQYFDTNYYVDYTEFERKNDVKEGENPIFLVKIAQCPEVEGFEKYDLMLLSYDSPDMGYFYGQSDEEDGEGPLSYSEKYNDYWGYIHFEGWYGQRFIDFSSVNNLLGNVGIGSLKTPIEMYGGAFCIYEPYYMYGNFGFNIWRNQTVDNDSVSVSLKGFDVFAKHGYPIFDNGWFQMAPYYGLGYSKATLTESWTQVTTQAGQSIFEADQYLAFKHTNPAFTLDLGVDLKLRYRFIGIDIKGGRLFDVSDRSWNSGPVDNGGLKSGLGGFYFLAGASISFGYW
ncbi:MAG: hypothetical protein H6598_03225 [Flavobacteriales bacterium]|nr:hypothetical protein [Flavobacteriales bacterium]